MNVKGVEPLDLLLDMTAGHLLRTEVSIGGLPTDRRNDNAHTEPIPEQVEENVSHDPGGGEFEGDTVFELPGGGTVNVVRNGDEYEVEVEVDEMMEDAEKTVRVRRERGQDGEVRVEKRVIVVKEEE